jgi:hypothetical protein
MMLDTLRRMAFLRQQASLFASIPPAVAVEATVPHTS